MRRLLATFAAFAIIAACVDEQVDPGTDAALQVPSGQFWRRAMPGANGGPEVLAASFPGTAEASRNDLAGGGELGSSATGVAIGLSGDIGYWTVRAAVPNNGAPTSPIYGFGFGLAASVPPGPRQLVLHAVDGNGRFGPAEILTLNVTARAIPTGALVVALTWDTEVDLDLHVVLPSGLELFKRNTTEYQEPPPNQGVQDPTAEHDGGILDRDSNAHCVLDGEREEDAIWANPPPTGHYIVRVDTFSLCNAASANWRVEAVLNGTVVGTASGVATDNDVRFSHDRGAGVTALEFDVP